MICALSVAAGLSAVLAIAASRMAPPHGSFYALKPLTTLLILAVAASAHVDSSPYQMAVIAALALSCAGDVCLMFEGERWFAAGMLFFLLAHLAFVAAFVSGVGVNEPPWWSGAALVWGAALQTVLWRRTGRLRIPVLGYGVVLVTMFLAAAARHAVLGSDASLRAVLGAGLFVVSDSLLSVQQFVRPYPGAQTFVLSSYWIAIWLIARSV